MLSLKWSRLTTLGLFLLVLLACWTESKNTSSKKELRVRNKREGTWSGWSVWSPCSRSCGGGIRTQIRQCQIRRDRSSSKSKEVGDDPRNFKNVSSRHCEGHGNRHHLCNIHDCPKETIDFRESQCKAFDNRAYMGKVYSWESFIDERNPCALTCRAKGFRFFATLNKSVIDGTSCNFNPFDSHVCISGVCTPIGCDGIAGSQRRLDRCGVCGGDNSTCRVVSGIFTRPQLSVGYNLVAHIPQGACNLNITQIRKSTNRLALRKIDGSFILNGDWRLSWQGIYEGAGAKFYYTRQDTKSLESIGSTGPLDESVDLMVLYQQPNPGIKYEYMLPLSDSSIPQVPILDPLSSIGNRQQNAATYRPTSYVNNPLINNGNNGHLVNAFNTISSFPKPSLSSVSTPTGSGLGLFPGDSASTYNQPEIIQQTHPHLHGHQSRRRGHSINKVGGVSDKKFYWKIVGYTNCSDVCGGGTQKSQIKCVKSPAANTVSDRRCVPDEKPVQQTIRCNVKPCPAEWDVGAWSICSELCGEGLKTRTVHCQQKISPTLTMRVAEGACLKPKPESQNKCFIRPCHRWEESEWSQCSAKCGNGIRRRTVICLDGRGQKIDKQDCDHADRPLEISPCNMGPCEGVDWFMSDWSSECSQRCGSGVQTRHVVCSGSHQNFTGRRQSLSSETETNSIEDEDPSGEEDGLNPLQTFFCDDGRKPKEERECFSDRSCSDPSWFTGEWSECSTECGNGLKTRQVLCVLFSRGKFKVVEESLCSISNRPEEKVQCESNIGCPPRWFISEWNECSVTCGGGTQKRGVSCRAGNWTKPSTYCADVDRPLDKRSCNEQKCSLAPSKSTDNSGMVKDTPPGALLIPSNVRNSSFVGVKVNIPTTNPPISRIQPKEPSEDPEDPDCTDQYRNCPLVVQARLCRYKYYRSVCCRACSEATDLKS